MATLLIHSASATLQLKWFASDMIAPSLARTFHRRPSEPQPRTIFHRDPPPKHSGQQNSLRKMSSGEAELFGDFSSSFKDLFDGEFVFHCAAPLCRVPRDALESLVLTRASALEPVRSLLYLSRSPHVFAGSATVHACLRLCMSCSVCHAIASVRTLTHSPENSLVRQVTKVRVTWRVHAKVRVHANVHTVRPVDVIYVVCVQMTTPKAASL